jgi:hypothetical protein
VRGDPADVDGASVIYSGVRQRLGNGKIRVPKLYVFADEGYFYFTRRIFYPADYLLPLAVVWLRVFELKLFAKELP